MASTLDNTADTSTVSLCQRQALRCTYVAILLPNTMNANDFVAIRIRGIGSQSEPRLS